MLSVLQCKAFIDQGISLNDVTILLRNIGNRELLIGRRKWENRWENKYIINVDFSRNDNHNIKFTSFIPRMGKQKRTRTYLMQLFLRSVLGSETRPMNESLAQ